MTPPFEWIKYESGAEPPPGPLLASELRRLYDALQREKPVRWDDICRLEKTLECRAEAVQNLLSGACDCPGIETPEGYNNHATTCPRSGWRQTL